MSRPPFLCFDGFIETAFERRFQSVLRSAWQRRSWHVIVAEPGSGKTMGITDLVRATGLPSGTLAGRSYPVLAVTAPKNDPKERALGDYLISALGSPSGRVVMDYVMKLVTTALEWSYEAGETDVRAETLEAAAELLTLRRDAIRMIDGTGPTIEVRSPETTEQGSTVGAELRVESVQETSKQRRKKTEAQRVEDGEMRIKAEAPDKSKTASVLGDAPDAISLTKPKRTRRAAEPKPKRHPVGEVETEYTA